MPVEMQLRRIIISDYLDQPQVMYLKETEGDREFPIVIGLYEAMQINRRIQGKTTPRPLTHDLVINVIRELGGQLEYIYIHDLREHTYYAKLVVRCNGETVEIDSRPSDAIAVAVTLGAPIYVDESVLERALEEES